MEKCIQTANLFLATLKVIYQIHQFNHWTNKKNFYSSHLLFQRLYESTLEDIDNCAEKFIGLFSVKAVDFLLQATLVNNIIINYKDKSGFEQSLAIELKFQELIKDSIDCFNEENTMTNGLENFLQGIADRHETNIYLLKMSIE